MQSLDEGRFQKRRDIGGRPQDSMNRSAGRSLFGRGVVCTNAGSHENYGNHEVIFLKLAPFKILQIPVLLGNHENHENQKMQFSKTTPDGNYFLLELRMNKTAVKRARAKTNKT